MGASHAYSDSGSNESGKRGPLTLIVASWGDPADWIECEYYVCESPYKTRFSTRALASCFNPCKILIFLQDSLLLNMIIESESFCNMIFEEKKTFSRKDIKGWLICGTQIYTHHVGSLSDRKRRLLEESMKEFGGFYQEFGRKLEVLVVPGVASYRRGAYIYTWRGGREDLYKALLAGIIGYVLRALDELDMNRESEKADGARIIVDTSHGINYFAIALKEGTTLALVLYSLRRGLRPIPISICYNNSDPLIQGGEQAEGASVRVNLIGNENVNALVIPRLRSFLENYVAESGSLKVAADRLYNMWRDCYVTVGEWAKALTAGLMLVRGAPIWALRIAVDTRVPNARDVLDMLENVNVNTEVKRRAPDESKEYKLTYRWDCERSPFVEVLVVGEVVNALKELAREILAEQQLFGRIVEELKKYQGACRDIVGEIVSSLERLGEKAPIFDLEKTEILARSIYPPDQASLIINEIRRLKHRLQEEKVRAQEDERRPSLFKVDGDSFLMPPTKGARPSPRNFYAHAGFAIGAPFLAVHVDCKLVVYPFDYKLVIEIAKQQCK